MADDPDDDEQSPKVFEHVLTPSEIVGVSMRLMSRNLAITSALQGKVAAAIRAGDLEERFLTQVARQKALELEALGGSDRREWAERVAFAVAAKSGTDRISHLKFEIEQLDRTIAITNRLQHDRRIARSLLAASLITTVAAVLVGNLGVAVVGLCFAPAIGASLYLIDMPRYDRPSIDSGHLR